MNRALLALVILIGGACAHTQTDPQVLQRLSVIEQRLDAQQRALDEARHHDSDVELSALAGRLDALRAELAALSEKQAHAPVAHPVRREPDQALTYGVPVGTSPSVGSPKAKVTLIMAGEFACPYCRKAWDTVEDLRKKYGADLRVVYKSFIVHPKVATIAAHAACAAAHQGKFHEMAELLWVKAFDARSFDQANIDAVAKEAKLDMKRYHADLTGPCRAEVTAENAEMAKFGVGATPSFFVNGRYFAGALPEEQFSALIDEEAAKADTAIKGGVKPEKFYDTEIVGKGLKELAP